MRAGLFLVLTFFKIRKKTFFKTFFELPARFLEHWISPHGVDQRSDWSAVDVVGNYSNLSLLRKIRNGVYDVAAATCYYLILVHTYSVGLLWGTSVI